ASRRVSESVRGSGSWSSWIKKVRRFRLWGRFPTCAPISDRRNGGLHTDQQGGSEIRPPVGNRPHKHPGSRQTVSHHTCIRMTSWYAATTLFRTCMNRSNDNCACCASSATLCSSSPSPDRKRFTEAAEFC